MATVAELLVKISGDSSGLQKELAASQRQIKRAYGSEALEASSKALTLMGGLAAAMGVVGVASIKLAADMEQNRIAFTTMLESASAADSLLKDLANFAASTPFEFTGLVTNAKKLLAMGFAANELLPILRSIGDAVAAVGGSGEVLDRVTLAFGQMKAKGMVSAEEMRQLAEAGIPAWQMLAKTLGVTVPEAMDLAEKKAINADGAIAGMLEQMASKYGGMMEKQSQTITGLFSNIKDKVGLSMITLGEIIAREMDLKTKLKGAYDWLDDFSGAIKASGIEQALIDLVPTGLAASIYAVSGAITASMIPALGRLALAAYAAMVPLLPLIAVGAALGLAVYGAQKYGQAMFDASNSVGGFVPPAEEATKVTDEAAESMRELGYGTRKAADSYSPLAAAAKKAAGPLIDTSKAAAKEMEKLEHQAEQTSKSIEREWVQLTNTQIQQLDHWYQDELADLEKSKVANENYERDLLRLKETYDAKKKKIDENEYNRIVNLKRAAQDAVTGNKNRDAGIGLTGVGKSAFDLKTGMDKEIQDVTRKYEDMVNEFSTLDADAKANNIKAWQEAGLAFKVNEDGTVDFTSQAEAEKLTIRKDYAERYKQLEYDRVKFQEDLEKAHHDGDIQRFTELLATKQAMEAQDLAGRQQYLDQFYAIWQDTHRSAMSYMAESMGTMYNGLSSALTDIITGAKSASEAFSDLGKSIVKMLAQWVAQYIAGQLVMALFGVKMQEKQVATSVAAGIATATAWAPAAAMVSLATMGGNAEPAIAGMIAATGVAYGLSIPQLASGGITTGPTLAEIGERGKEAVLPLNRRAFEKAGLTGGTSARAEMNIYGDINTKVQLDEVMEDLGQMVYNASLGVV